MSECLVSCKCGMHFEMQRRQTHVTAFADSHPLLCASPNGNCLHTFKGKHLLIDTAVIEFLADDYSYN